MRALRRRITATGTSVALRWGPRVPGGVLNAIEGMTARLGPHAPVIGRMVTENMRAAGIDQPWAAARAYFRQAALHAVNAVRAFKRGAAGPRLIEMAREQVAADASIERLKGALAGGRGALVATAHVCNYVLTLARLNLETPVCVYLRWSKNARKRELTRRWCDAAGVRVIVEPADASDPTSRAAACVEVLREGAALVITPDIAQKRGHGAAVHLMGRTGWLPVGPASIAMLAEAPMVPVFGRVGRISAAVDRAEDGPALIGRGRPEYHLIQVGEIIDVRRPSKSEGGRKEGVRRAMQAWAEQFERFVLACPEAWFLWADSRWTRFFRGDAEYCDDIARAGASPESDGATEGPSPTRGNATENS